MYKRQENVFAGGEVNATKTRVVATANKDKQTTGRAVYVLLRVNYWRAKGLQLSRCGKQGNYIQNLVTDTITPVTVLLRRNEPTSSYTPLCVQIANFFRYSKIQIYSHSVKAY